MSNILLIFEIIIAILLIFLILIQSGDAGLSGVWSGGGETYHSKRGVEKIVFIATIVSAVLFVGIALIILISSAQSLPSVNIETESPLIELEDNLDSSFSAQFDATPASEAIPLIEKASPSIVTE